MGRFTVLTILFSVQVFAGEGFFRLQELPDLKAQQAFFSFPRGKDCGAVRIHNERSYYLTALHCLRSARDPDEYVSVGNPLNPEALNYYSYFSGTELRIESLRLKVLAHGRCWTGFGVDVISDISQGEQAQAIQCLQGDWALFELLSGEFPAAKCLPVDLTAGDRSSVSAIGGPRSIVRRSVGLSQLDGRVYTNGEIFSLGRLLAEDRFPIALANTWRKFEALFSSLNSQFLLSDVDVINGMSGGPVVTTEGLIGISTVALLPNYIFEYPGLTTMSEGYNFGIHGGVSIQQILSPTTEAFFHCPL
jgi:hypothetical protein